MKTQKHAYIGVERGVSIPTATPDSRSLRCPVRRRSVHRWRPICRDGYYGAYVCDECGAHRGLERCYCGWSVTEEMGETIEGGKIT